MENVLSAAIALIALAAMEIVLGIDNIVFISLLSSRLPAEQQARARQIGLFAAMGTRILLLCGIYWVQRADDPIFSLSSFGVAGEWLAKNSEVNHISIR